MHFDVITSQAAPQCIHKRNETKQNKFHEWFRTITAADETTVDHNYGQSRLVSDTSYSFEFNQAPRWISVAINKLLYT